MYKYHQGLRWLDAEDLEMGGQSSIPIPNVDMTGKVVIVTGASAGKDKMSMRFIYLFIYQFIYLFINTFFDLFIGVNIGCPSRTHLKLKSRQISSLHNIRSNCPIVLKFCTEYDDITAAPCAKLQNDWINDKWVMGKREFAIFQFKSLFGRVSKFAPAPVYMT